ncbi:MAG: sulfite exporter TauE/SafE family protein, partial [Vicingaceae bacterium]
GSLHCLGMCGPIAFALPLDRSNNFSAFSGSLVYNIGRLLTYFSLGVIFGLLGYGFFIAGFQRWISIAVGVIMILSVVLPYFSKNNRLRFPSFNLWIGKVKGELGKQLGKKSTANLFAIGLLNGLLPCGLVYMGLAGATAMATATSGGLFMLVFGLGTLPLMLAVAFFGNQIKTKLMTKARKLIPAFIILIGSLFILRGMNLGVPYLSPKLDNQTEVVNCH